MSAAAQQLAPAPTAEAAVELAADLVKLGVRPRIAGRLARDTVFSKESLFFRGAHVIAHAGKKVDHTKIIRVLQKHGQLPQPPKGRA